MKLLTLPTELIIQIIQYLPSIKQKLQLLQTCSQLKELLCTQLACWTELDFSAHSTVSNAELLLFLNSRGIKFQNNIPIISSLNLSGCWCLSQDMIILLSKAFMNLKELHLNGYKLQQLDNKYQERDHLYQMRPSHDLSSITMDLSKKSIYQLKIGIGSLVNIIKELNEIKLLSIQYQDLSLIQQSYNIFEKIESLDISSCIMNQSGLQTLIRKSGKCLKSLKMLNIELSSLSWLCLGQHCKKLICLHISCIDPTYLNCIKECISNLNLLQDFRLTRLRTGNLDLIVKQLNPLILNSLDLSPKMNIYLNNNPITRTIKTTEHDLLLTDIGLQHLFQFNQLKELRLCFPYITSQYLKILYKSLPQLEIFELRRQLYQQEKDDLNGIQYLINLKEIYLYSIILTIEAKQVLLKLPLNHITLINATTSSTVPLVVTGDTIDHTFLYNSNHLKSIYLGQNLSFEKKNNRWLNV